MLVLTKFAGQICPGDSSQNYNPIQLVIIDHLMSHGAPPPPNFEVSLRTDSLNPTEANRETMRTRLRIAIAAPSTHHFAQQSRVERTVRLCGRLLASQITWHASPRSCCNYAGPAEGHTQSGGTAGSLQDNASSGQAPRPMSVRAGTGRCAERQQGCSWCPSTAPVSFTYTPAPKVPSCQLAYRHPIAANTVDSQ